MTVPYLAHIPYVLAFLAFVVIFIAAQALSRRH